MYPYLILNVKNDELIKLIMTNTKIPLCQCGNTSNPNGYCDGSYSK